MSLNQAYIGRIILCSLPPCLYCFLRYALSQVVSEIHCWKAAFMLKFSKMRPIIQQVIVSFCLAPFQIYTIPNLHIEGFSGSQDAEPLCAINTLGPRTRIAATVPNQPCLCKPPRLNNRLSLLPVSLIVRLPYLRISL